MDGTLQIVNDMFTVCSRSVLVLFHFCSFVLGLFSLCSFGKVCQSASFEGKEKGPRAETLEPLK